MYQEKNNHKLIDLVNTQTKPKPISEIKFAVNDELYTLPKLVEELKGLQNQNEWLKEQVRILHESVTTIKKVTQKLIRRGK